MRSLRDESGKATAWILAFVLAAGLGLGGLIGVGCLVGANACPWGDEPRQTTTDGAELYAANCAVCHGPQGMGGRGPSLVSGRAATMTLSELQARIARGKPLAGMPAFKRSLTPEQIEAVARYVMTLREPAGPARPTATPTGAEGTP